MDTMHTNASLDALNGQLVIPGFAHRVCRICKETVRTYRPTGTQRVFAEWHDITPGYRCSGSRGYTVWTEGI